MDLFMSYFEDLSLEAVCHPVLVSLVNSKTFLPIHDLFPVILFTVAGSSVVENNLLSWLTYCA